jgi:hypothetical protein
LPEAEEMRLAALCGGIFFRRLHVGSRAGALTPSRIERVGVGDFMRGSSLAGRRGSAQSHIAGRSGELRRVAGKL